MPAGTGAELGTGGGGRRLGGRGRGRVAGVPVPSVVGSGTGVVAASEPVGVGVGLLSGVAGSANAAAGLTSGRCAGGATAVLEVGAGADEAPGARRAGWAPRVWPTATTAAVTRTAAAAATTGRRARHVRRVRLGRLARCSDIVGTPCRRGSVGSGAAGGPGEGPPATHGRIWLDWLPGQTLWHMTQVPRSSTRSRRLSLLVVVPPGNSTFEFGICALDPWATWHWMQLRFDAASPLTLSPVCR